MASGKGKTICLFSAKGGVGKTITTLNLAGMCASKKKKTLIIDLDLCSGGISVSLNKEVTKTIYNLVDDLNNNRYKEFNDYITNYNSNIDFLASPKDPRQGIRITSKFIDLIIDRAAYIYDVILIDTTHVLNDVNLVTLDKVDNILFLVTNDPLDIKNMKSILSIFNDLEIDKYDIVLNNSCDPNKKYFKIDEISSLLKSKIKYIIPPKFYVKNIDEYIMEGKIMTTYTKFSFYYPSTYEVLSKIITDILKQEEMPEVLDEKVNIKNLDDVKKIGGDISE